MQLITEKVAFELSVQDVHGGLFANPFVSVFACFKISYCLKQSHWISKKLNEEAQQMLTIQVGYADSIALTFFILFFVKVVCSFIAKSILRKATGRWLLGEFQRNLSLMKYLT